jgi:hypothetical protein
MCTIGLFGGQYEQIETDTPFQQTSKILCVCVCACVSVFVCVLVCVFFGVCFFKSLETSAQEDK